MIPKSQPQLKAFTVEYNGITRVLNSDVIVYRAFDPRNTSIDAIYQIPKLQCRGLWDTGATASVITQKVVDAIGLTPIGKTRVSTPSGIAIQNTYFVNIFLPNQVGVAGLTVTCGEMTSCEVLIGMDVISQGDFCLTNAEGKSVFSFQMPPTHQIDFVKETIHPKENQPIVLPPKVGRNSPCPCGSGKKYKQCCGK